MEAVELDDRDGVVLVRFGDPARRNALSRSVLQALGRTARQLAEGRARAAVVAGRGDHFSSGADLADVRAAARAPATYIQEVQDAIAAWAALPFPTVAAIEGWALGGGLELAAACDLRIASREARVGLPEIRWGLHPAAGGLARLPRLLGLAWTTRLAYSGEPVTAPELAPTGFFARLTDPGASVAGALEVAAFIADRPGAAGTIRRLLRAAGSPDGEALRGERQGFARCLAQPGTLARLDAFLADGAPE